MPTTTCHVAPYLLSKSRLMYAAICQNRVRMTPVTLKAITHILFDIMLSHAILCDGNSGLLHFFWHVRRFNLRLLSVLSILTISTQKMRTTGASLILPQIPSTTRVAKSLSSSPHLPFTIFDARRPKSHPTAALM